MNDKSPHFIVITKTKNKVTNNLLRIWIVVTF